jgi:hypothetical protein
MAEALRTYRKALTWVDSHQDETLRLFASANKLNSETGTLTFGRHPYVLAAPSEDFLADPKRRESELKAFGVLTKSVEWDAAVDHKIAKEALAGA